jgi:hypothetical protein
MTRTLTTALFLLSPLAARAADYGEVVVTFAKPETGKPVVSHKEQDVVFAPARPPAKSKATAKVMFFPHLKTEKAGILNAMADDPIPVEVRFPRPAASVTLVLWGSIGNGAVVEAYDKDGKVLDTAKRDKVPARDRPDKPVPSFELTVKGAGIISVRFSGAPPGGYLVCDEVRYTPLSRPEK